jgi:hypothetical protein
MRTFEGWTFRRWRVVKRKSGRHVYIRVESPTGELRDVYIGPVGVRRKPGRPRRNIGAPPVSTSEE